MNEDNKKRIDTLAENFTYLYQLNNDLKNNLSLSLEHGYLKFENLTTLIKIINNSLVKELNINLSDLKQNLLNIALVIKNNKLEMLGK